jgi:hypothetical protein
MSRRSKPKTPTPMVSVYSGQHCIGFIMERAKLGFQALTSGEEHLGYFTSRREAAKAIGDAYAAEVAAD